jgi:drug/metabolite transporter (DMT)-like permease
MATGKYGYMKTNRRHAVAALVAAGLLWGTTVPMSKVALSWLSPGWLTAARFGLAAAVLLTWAMRYSGPAGLRAAFRPGVLAAGVLGYGGSVMLQNAGISRTSVTHAALLIGAAPVLVAIIAAAWYRIVARPVAWFGFMVSLTGVGLVTVGGGGGATITGDALVLASVLVSAAVIVAQGRLLARRDAVAVCAVQFMGAALGALPVAVLTEGAPAGPGGAVPVLAAVALAGFGTLLPFTLFAFGQSRVSAEVAGAFVNLEPLVGAVAGAVAFGDPVGLAQIAGGVAVLAGIGLSSLPLVTARRAVVRGPAIVSLPTRRPASQPAPAGRRTVTTPAGARNQDMPPERLAALSAETAHLRRMKPLGRVLPSRHCRAGEHARSSGRAGRRGPARVPPGPPAVPCRPRRQPAAPAAPASGARRLRRGPDYDR